MWFPVALFNKSETTKKYGKIKGKINPDEPSGHFSPWYGSGSREFYPVLFQIECTSLFWGPGNQTANKHTHGCYRIHY